MNAPSGLGLSGSVMGRLPALPVNPDPPRILGPDGRPLDDGGKLAIAPQHFFAAVWNSISQTYSYRYDEAIRRAPQDALAMLRDASVNVPLNERYREVIQQPWTVKPEVEEDGDQKQAASLLTTVLRRTPCLPLLFHALEQMVWYGRSACQVAFGPDTVQGKPATVCKVHAHVNGDKVQFRWDGTPAVYVRGSDVAGRYASQGGTVGTASQLGVTPDLDPADPRFIHGELAPMLLLERHFRKQFLVSKFYPADADYFDAEQAGGIHGVGLRSGLYWAWWMKSELLGWALNYMRKVGTLGLLVFPYRDGDATAKLQAEQNAKDAGNRTALTLPVSPGTDPKQLAPFVISPSTAGIETLIHLMDKYFDWRIERGIIGQSASSKSDSGGMGTHDTDAQQSTKYRIIRGDCELLAEYLTTDLLWQLQEYNLPGSLGRFKLRFEFNVPDPLAESRMKALESAAKFVPVKASDIRDATGAGKPGPEDEAVGGPGAMAGQPAAAGAGGAGGGGTGGLGLAAPSLNGDADHPDRYDFNPNQPRADDGTWSDAGGGHGQGAVGHAARVRQLKTRAGQLEYRILRRQVAGGGIGTEEPDHDDDTELKHVRAELAKLKESPLDAEGRHGAGVDYKTPVFDSDRALHWKDDGLGRWVASTPEDGKLPRFVVEMHWPDGEPRAQWLMTDLKTKTKLLFGSVHEARGAVVRQVSEEVIRGRNQAPAYSWVKNDPHYGNVVSLQWDDDAERLVLLADRAAKSAA